jgi:hypothetical protein
MAPVIDEDPDARDVIVIRPTDWPGADEGDAAGWLQYDRAAVTATWFGFDRTHEYAGAVKGFPYSVIAVLSQAEERELEAARHRFADRLQADAAAEQDPLSHPFGSRGGR